MMGEHYESRKKSFTPKALSPMSGLSFLGVSAKRIERSSSLSNEVNNPHSIFIQEYCLTSEFNLLRHRVESGVYVIPAARTPFVWFGVIFVRSGLYLGGIFRFRLFIPRTFPQCTVCPKLIFETPVFHPYVNPSTDELYFGGDNLFSEWRKDANHLWQLIAYARNIFYNVSSINAVNTEAAELYENDREKFVKLVKTCVQSSRVRIYEKSSDDDPHYLIFDEYNLDVHEPYREMLLKEKERNNSEDVRTVSWVRQGSLKPLSKEE